jgi:hypothetical protein
MKLTVEEIEAGKSEAGGYTKAKLAEWGISWPPPKGWKEMLLAGEEPPVWTPEPVTELEEAWARELCLAMYGDPDLIIGAPEQPTWRSYLSYARWSIQASEKLGSGFSQRQLTYLLTLTGENTGMSAIRPSSFTAMDVLALREKLKEMRDDAVQ